MPTVNAVIAGKIIKHNGMYHGDRVRVVRVTEYENNWGGLSYGLDYEDHRPSYAESQYIHNPRVIWEYKP